MTRQYASKPKTATAKAAAMPHLRRKRAKVGRDQLLHILRRGPWEPPGGWDQPDVQDVITKLLSSGISSKSLPLATVAMLLLTDRQPDTVRGTMYAVVSAGWLPDTGKKSYKAIQRLLNVLRNKGVVPHSWIVDNIRSTEKPSSWSGLTDFADAVARSYRLNYWASLPDYVCLIVEKDTVAGRIVPVTRTYDVALHPLRGFSSTSFAFAIADRWRRIEKPIYCYYIGDFDPSGMEIEKSIKERLAEYAGRDFFWGRLAVQPEHFETYNVIPLAAKKKDSRYRRFVDTYGTDCAEVEAIPADALRDMVEDAIQRHIPTGEWERLEAIEAAERDSWKGFIGKIKGGSNAE